MPVLHQELPDLTVTPVLRAVTTESPAAMEGLEGPSHLVLAAQEAQVVPVLAVVARLEQAVVARVDMLVLVE